MKKPFAQAGDGVLELNAWKAQKICEGNSQAGMFLLRIIIRFFGILLCFLKTSSEDCGYICVKKHFIGMFISCNEYSTTI